MAKKTKKVTISNVTLEQAQAASEQYAQTQAKLATIEAKMNEELNKVKSKFKDQITELQDELEPQVEVLEVFAKEQQPAWGKKKSMELLHCTIGFRTGTPKVEKDKKFTWDAITELLGKNKVFKPFIRTKQEIDKEAILACKDEALLEQLKEDAYVSIVQDETFYVEAKREEVAAA
jgi:phage host-nuclease inhibitor protein Gam